VSSAAGDTDPVIIEVAINGMVQKDLNRHVPQSPAEIAADSLACLDAGAAIIHNHIEELGIDGDEAAARYVEGWLPVLDRHPDALFYPTTNAGPGVQHASAHVAPLAATGHMKIYVLDPGSVNSGAADADGVPEGPGLYAKTFDDIRYLRDLCDEHSLGPSLAIFEPGFLRTTMRYVRAGQMPRGAMIKLYFGDETGGRWPRRKAPFGLAPTTTALAAYDELMADNTLPWSVCVVGGDLTSYRDFALDALGRGAHLRVGIEDYRGDREPTNVELVEGAVALCEAAGRSVANYTEAARMLELPRCG
jgi:uncharacterized protein (DUF849 family)